MDTRKLSSFIIAIGIILLALGAGNWAMVENRAKQAEAYRRSAMLAEAERNHLTGTETLKEKIRKLKAQQRMWRNASSELDMLSRGYVRSVKIDHTFSYALMIGGILVLIVGIGMRVSTPSKQNTMDRF